MTKFNKKRQSCYQSLLKQGSFLLFFLVCSCLSTVHAQTLGFTSYGQPFSSEFGKHLFQDIDNDGDLDIIRSTQTSVLILKNDGSGNFSLAHTITLGTTNSGATIAVDKFDGDNLHDIFIGSNGIFINNGDGTSFTQTQTTAVYGGNYFMAAATTGDVDNDGDIDIFATRKNAPQVFMQNDGTGTFVEKLVSGHADNRGVATGNFDADADLEIVTAACSCHPDEEKLFDFNSGTGTDTYTHHSDLPLSTNSTNDFGGLVIVDANGDGNDDVITGRTNTGLALYTGDGALGFSNPVTFGSGIGTFGIINGDFDNDGHLDVYLSNIGGGDAVFLGDGSGGFTNANLSLSASQGRGVKAGDVDGDGDLDIAVMTHTAGLEFWMNDFISPPPPICGTATWTGAAGDGNWKNGANWSINQVPSDCNDIVINDGSSVTIPSGTVEARTINLGITNTYTAATGNASSLTIASGATLEVTNPSEDRTLVLFGGTSVTNNGTLNITESGRDALTIWGEMTNNVGATVTISNAVRKNLTTGGTEGVFHNNGTLDLVNLETSYLENNATFNNNATGVLNISGGFVGITTKNLGYFNNYGTILIDNPLHRGIGVAGCSTCHFNNFSTGVIEIRNIPTEGTGHGLDVGRYNTLNNDGSILIDNIGKIGLRYQGHINNNSTGTITIKNSVDKGVFIRQHLYQGFDNAGLLSITNSGGTSFEGENSGINFNNTGIVEGDGNWDPKIAVNGTYAPGIAGGVEIGTMNFTGNQTFTGTFDMDITDASTHDQITGTSSLNISGVTLNLTVDENYQPAAGDRLVIVSGSAITGQFVTNSTLPLYFTVDYSVAGEVALLIESDPEIEVDNAGNMDFGMLLIGNSSTKSYTITNTSSSDLILGEITSSDAQFAIANYTAATLSNGQTATFDVIYSPTIAGNNTATISIANNDLDESPYTFNVTGESGEVGAGLAFDGLNDDLKNFLSTDYDLSSFTFETWVKTTPNSGSFRRIYDSQAYADFTFRVSANNDNLVFNVLLNNQNINVLTSSTLTEDKWYHIAVTGDGNTVKLYVDGELDDESSQPSNVVWKAVDNIGGAAHGTVRFNGSLDELRMWSVERSCGEITSSMNCELTGSEAGLISYFQFNQGIGGIDNSGVANAINSVPGGSNATFSGFDLNGTVSNFIAPGGVTTGTACNGLTTPEITVDEMTVGTDFGTVIVNATPGSMTYTITNDGGGDLVLGTISSSDAQFSIVNYTATTLTAGQTTSFDVEFAPSASGAQMGTISIVNDDCDENPYTFDVTGNGLPLTVVNTNNTGEGSLRQVYADAPAGSTIDFNIPGNGPHNILLTSTLGIGKSIIIDAKTQPGYVAGTPAIAINGLDNWTNIFHLVGNSDVTIDAIDMTYAAGACGSTKQGIGIFVQNSGTVNIQNCKFGHRRLGLNLFNSGAVFLTDNDFRDAGHNGIRSSVRIIGNSPLLAQGNLWGGCSNSMIGAESPLNDLYIGTDVNHAMNRKIIIQPGEGFDEMTVGLSLGTNIIVENVDFKKSPTAGNISALSFSGTGSVTGSTFEGFNYGLNVHGTGPVTVECSAFLDNNRGINTNNTDLTVTNSSFACNALAIYNSNANEVAAENNYFGGAPQAGDFFGTVDAEPYLSTPAGCAAISVNEITVNEVSEGTDFGDVLVGTSATQTYTITNDGTADLTLGSITSNNGEFVITGYSATTLSTGMTATFNVVYTPTAVGTDNGNISIVNDDCNENPYTFNVTGTGSCLTIDEVTTTGEGCPDAADGTITVTASCPTCASGFEYALDGGSYQASNLFENVAAGTHTVSVRDLASPSCVNTTDATVAVGTDSVDPVITCGANVTVVANEDCEIVMPDLTVDASATDDCDANPMFSQDIAVGTTLAYETTTPVTITATDASGNTADCVVNVTVDAAIPPSFANCANITTDIDPGVPNALVAFPLLTDLQLQDSDCVTAATVDLGLGDGVQNFTDLNDAQYASGTYPIGETTVSYEITTIAGSTTCEFTVFVLDPVCNIEITNIDTGDEVCFGEATGTLTVSANCFSCPNGMADVEYSLNGTTFQASNVFTNLPAGSPTVYVRRMGVPDCNDSQVATIETDSENPTITCPAAQTVVADGSCEGQIPDVRIMVAASDNCSYSTVQDIATGTIFSETTTVTVTATDGAGNAASCTVEYSLVDAAAPTFTCETAITISIQTGGTTISAADLTTAGITDNCDAAPVVTLSQSVFDCADANTPVDVLMTVTDAAGNSDNCTVSVTAQSDAMLSITCPENQVVASDENCEGVMPDLVALTSASDDCSGSVTISQSVSGGTALTTTATTVTMTATSGANSTTCTVDVSLSDDTAPVLACPADLNMSTAQGSCNAFLILGGATATDNCSMPENITVSAPDFDTNTSLSPFNGAYFGLVAVGVHNVTFTGMDEAGNEGTCSMVITITDGEAPTFTSCPTFDIFEESDEDDCAADVQWPNVYADDNCSFVMTSTHISGDNFQTGSTEVTFTATDDAGNATDCVFNVVVEDATAPIAGCQDVTVELDANGEYALAGSELNNESSDNCTAPEGLTFTSSIANFVCAHTAYAQNVTLTVADAAGNEATCMALVTIEDNILPTATCQNFTAVLDATGNVAIEATDIDDGSTDNCSISFEITDGATAYDCSNSGMDFDLELTVTDLVGNTATCMATVSVVDTETPTITCPANITQTNDATLCSAVVNFADATFADNCPDAVLTSDLNSGDVFPVGTTDVTFTVTDASNNAADCTFSITVTDDEVPVAMCQDVTVELDAAGMASITTADVDNGSNDNCTDAANLTLALDNMDFDCDVLTTADNLALDFTGINDNTSHPFHPSFDYSNGVTAEAWINAAQWENQTYEGVIIENESFGGFNLRSGAGKIDCFVSFGAGTTTPKATTTGSLNTNTWYHVAMTYDGQFLKLFVNGVEEASTAATGTIVNPNSPQMLIGGRGNRFFDGKIDEVRIWNYARSASEIQSMMNAKLSGGESGVIVYYPFDDGTGSATAVDLGPNGLHATLNSLNPNTDWVNGAPNVPGNLNMSSDVTLTVTDEAGNSSTCTSTITIEDNMLPTIADCPADQTVSNDAGDCSAIVTWTAPTAADNCSVELTGTHASGDSFDVGETTVTYTAVDPSGNSVTCSFNITVEDNENPTIACPDNITQTNDAGDCSAAVTWNPIESNDNCPGASVTSNHDAGDVFPVGETTVEYTITDAANNVAMCSFTVTVTDDEDPVIADCPANITQDNDAGNCDAQVTWTEPTVSDNCSATITGDAAPNDVFPVGTTTVTYTAVDPANNTVTCTFDITVEDNEDPVITCPANIVQDTDAGSCDAVVTYAAPVGVDNCLGATTVLEAGLPSDATFPIGDTDVTYLVTDAAQNVVSCTFTVTIEDNEDPVIAACPANITQDNDTGNCDAQVTWTEPTVSDNCSATITGDAAPNDVFPVGTTTVTYNATDAAGNTAVCTFDIIVEDNEDPTVTCPANITQGNDLGNCDAVVTWDAVIFGDNCPASMISSTSESGDVFTLGTTDVTYTVTDAANNSVECTFTVTITDDEMPVMACNDLTIELDENGMASITETEVDGGTTDNCTLAENLTLSIDATDFACAQLGDANVVTLTATDEVNNTNTCTATIMVEDNIAPVVSDCPASMTFPALSSGCAGSAGWTLPSATDNCTTVTEVVDSEGTFLFVSGGSAFGTFPGGITTITYTYTDGSDNVSVCTFDITIEDNTPPMITGCPQNMNLDTEAGQCTAQALWQQPNMSDNCPGMTYTASHISGSDFPIGSTTVLYTAIDDIGNTATCSFDIVVTDNEAPTLDCPTAPLTAASMGNCMYEVPDLSALITMSDNCTNDLAGIQNPTAGAAISAATTVNFEVTDDAGNTIVCNVSIEIPMEMTLVTSSTDASCPSAADGSATVVITGGTAPYTILWSNGAPTENNDNIAGGMYDVDVTDANGCMASGTAVVNGTDTENPIADCENITIELDETGMASIVAADINDDSSDDCGVVNFAANVTEFDCSNVGNNDVVLTVTDGSGNSATCTATVTVEDPVGENPAFCGSTYNLPLDENGQATLTSGDLGSHSDNCGALTVFVLNNETFDCDDISNTNQVSIGIVDNNNNFSICNVNVTVEDVTAPIADCRDINVDLDDNGDATIVAENVNDNSSDNCAVANMSIDVNIFDCSNIGINTVTLTVEDAAGNSSTCEASVNIQDQSIPTPAFCGTTIALNLNGEGEANLTNADLGTIPDNCGTATAFIFGNASFDCSDIGATNMTTVGIFDASNNFILCNVAITVDDVTAPVANCMDVTISLDDAGMAIAQPNYVDNNSTDNCGITNMTISPNTFSCDDKGSHVVTLTVEDAAGQSSSCNADVLIIDDSIPTEGSFCGNTFTVDLDANGTGNFDIASLPTLVDNCGADVVVIPFASTSYDCNDMGTNVLSLGLMDDGNNFVLCNIFIAVSDPTDACTAAPIVAQVMDNNTDTAEQILEEKQGQVALTGARVYPNPFAVKAQIEYELGVPAQTVIEVYDATGRRVEMLLNRVVSSGKHRIFWTPQNQQHGLYFVRIQVENEPATMLKLQYTK